MAFKIFMRALLAHKFGNIVQKEKRLCYEKKKQTLFRFLCC